MDNWVFSHNEDDTVRYTLGEIGKRNLLCIGINPSTATPKNLDTTLKRVKEISRLNGYDGWLMLNIYPQRDRYPENIHKKEENEIIECNQKAVQEVLSKYPFNTVWAAWGEEIERRPYLLNCLIGLTECFDDKFRWINYGTLTKYGHPRHPSRMSYSEKFSTFDINEYINSQ
jgi:hypothetical protein